MRIAFYLSIGISVGFEVIWLFLRMWKWHVFPIGIPLLPLLCILLPLIAFYIDKNNRKLWVQLDSLEDIRSKYKSVCHVAFEQTIHYISSVLIIG